MECPNIKTIVSRRVIAGNLRITISTSSDRLSSRFHTGPRYSRMMSGSDGLSYLSYVVTSCHVLQTYSLLDTVNLVLIPVRNTKGNNGMYITLCTFVRKYVTSLHNPNQISTEPVKKIIL